ncbi:hypothetical protein [Candidatus Parabeggiatoa sp. HSG14]|uniref:hypothetical protein n=1 Tax=Candidatus Parabeggiatoa sp. HSG14 TaxID=3055593 RepID=UPI0025A6A5C3|nr:hypothetical protein [Thiotrichales bacterium HSG14]
MKKITYFVSFFIFLLHTGVVCAEKPTCDEKSWFESLAQFKQRCSKEYKENVSPKNAETSSVGNEKFCISISKKAFESKAEFSNRLAGCIDSFNEASRKHNPMALW